MNENDEILWKLGILTSNLQSPKKQQGISNVGLVDNDDSDSEVVFDQQTLLENQPRRRTSPSLRPVRVFVEALRWKLTCICTVVFAIGVSLSVFGPNACDFVTNGSTYRNFSANAFMMLGFGYLCGTFLGEQLYPRWNPLFVTMAQFFVLVPSVASLSLTHENRLILVLWMLNGIILGSLERGCYLLYHSLFKERRSLIFFIQLCMILGLMFGSFVFSQSADTFQTSQLHLMQKRSISGFAENETYAEYANLTLLTTATTTEKPKRPDSAVGIQKITGKTEENQEKRKLAEEKAKSQEQVDTTSAPTEAVVLDALNCTDSSSPQCANETIINSLAEVTNDTTGPEAPALIPEKLEATTTTTSTTTAASKITTTTETTTTTATTTTPSTTTTSTTTVAPTTAHYETAPTLSFVDNVHVDATTTDTIISTVTTPIVLGNLQYIAAAVFLTFALVPFVVGFCCCCLPFDFTRDDRIAELSGDQYLDSDCCRLKAYLFMFWSLLSLCDMAAVGVLAGALNDTQDQFSVRFSFGLLVYWTGAGLSRGALLLRPSPVISSVVVQLFLVFFVIPVLVLIFAGHNSTTGAICVFAMGAFGSPLSTCMYNWILATLRFNSYGLSRVLAVSGSFGKVSAPVALISWSWIDQSSDSTVKLICIGVIASAVLYFFIFRQVHTILRRRQIGELSSGVTGVSFHKKSRKDGYVTVLDEDDDSDVLSMEDVEVGDQHAKSALLQGSSDEED